MFNVLMFAFGVFIGWNFPQPTWAKLVQMKIQDWWKNLNVPK